MARVPISPQARHYLEDVGVLGRKAVPGFRASYMRTPPSRARVTRHWWIVLIAALVLFLLAGRARAGEIPHAGAQSVSLAAPLTLAAMVAGLLLGWILGRHGGARVPPANGRGGLAEAASWKRPVKSGAGQVSPRIKASDSAMTLPDRLDMGTLQAVFEALPEGCGPKKPPRRWGVGVTSAAGPVRRENQDYALAFDQCGCRVLLLADGMGGLPGGAEAARLAVLRAGRVLALALGTNAFRERPMASLQRAFEVAMGALLIRSGHAGEHLGKGLRTTLVVVVTDPHAHHYAYIGDGGLWLLRADGELELLLVPHRASGSPNVLHSSLGPETHGGPSFGSAPRRRGDLLVCGSDGVVDRVERPAEFAGTVREGARTGFDGDLQATTDEVIRQFAAARTDAGSPVCDDNLTLMVSCPDGIAPPLIHSQPHEVVA